MENALKPPNLDSKIEQVSLNSNLFIKLSELELSVRTLNCMKNENIIYIGDLVRYTESAILRIPNFGRKSLGELKELLEGFNLHFGMETPGWPPHNTEALSNIFKESEGDPDKIILVPSKEEIMTEEEAVKKYTAMGLLKRVDLLGLSMRSANCLHSDGIIYIGDLVLKKEEELLRTPNFGRKSLGELKEALDKIGLHFGMKLSNWPLNNIEALVLAQDSQLAHQVEEPLKEAFLRTMGKVGDSRHVFIMESRLGLHKKPQTLEEIAKELGITRERVRQIQKKITQNILKHEFWDDILRIRLKKLIAARTEPLFLDNIAQEDSWFIGFEDNLVLLENIIVAFSEMEDLSFLPYEGRKLVSRLSNEQWREMKYDLINMLEQTLNLGHTIDDIQMFVDSNMKKVGSSELSLLFFEELSKDLNFSLINGEMILVSVGNSLSSHLRAILETENKPIHFEDITKIYEQKYGVSISSRYVQSCLGQNGFLLFDRGTYGLHKHLKIPENIQESIRHTIEDRILSDTSERQWHAKDLIGMVVSEIYQGELNKYTVGIILKNSKKIRYLGKWLWKIRSTEDEISERLHIRTAVYDVLKSAGSPLRIETLQSLVSKARGTGDIFSLNPNEIYSRVDPSTWGLLDRDFVLSIKEQEQLKEFYFMYFTRVRKALHKSELLQTANDLDLPFELTDNQVSGILASDPRFKSWHGGFIGISQWADPGRRSFTTVLREVVEKVSGSIQASELVKLVRSEIGYNFNRNNIAVHLNKWGFYYDKDTGAWKKDPQQCVIDGSNTNILP